MAERSRKPSRASRPSSDRGSGGTRGGGASKGGRGSGRSDSRRGSGSGPRGGQARSDSGSRGGTGGRGSGSSRDDGRRSGGGGRGQGRGDGRRGSGAGTGSRNDRDRGPRTTPRAERSGWGSVAKHGAIGATIGQRNDERDTEERFSPEERRKFEERQARRAANAARTESLRGEARAAIGRSEAGRSTTSKPDRPTVDRSPLPGRPPKQRDIPKDLERVHGSSAGQRQWRLFTRAAREFENEQFEDARRTLKPLVDANPSIPEMRELYGLALYRLGKWDLAIEQLERFRVDAGTAEQHPPLMDAHRALGNWADVDELWNELGEQSPAADLVVEGRIVRAGAEADQGRLDGAIRILEKGWKVPSQPQAHHLRRAYALADLFEQAGNLPRSRKLFGWVASVAPDFGDAAERAHALD